jgi:hypothetical protein
VCACGPSADRGLCYDINALLERCDGLDREGNCFFHFFNNGDCDGEIMVATGLRVGTTGAALRARMCAVTFGGEAVLSDAALVLVAKDFMWCLVK